MRESTQVFNTRQEMYSQSFEVFHYQDRKLDNVNIHHHDFYEVYFLLSGQVEYRVEGRIYHLKPGDLLLISPLELHQPIFPPGNNVYERFVLWINKSFLEDFSTDEASLTRCFDNALPSHTNLLRPTASQRSELTLRFGELVRESYSREYGGQMCASGIFLQLLVELNRLALGRREERSEDSSPLVSQVLTYISDHYDQDLTLESLSQQFYVSKYHLSHEFSRVVGTSVHRYLTLKRLMIARQMLSGGVAPGVVYSHCGFGDYANFYRAFKSRYGVSPREFMVSCQN